MSDEIVGNISAFIKGWNASQEENWISVKDRLPQQWGMYLTRYCSPGISPTHVCHQVLHFNNQKNKWNTEYSSDIVTHWMPLPEAPK